MKDAFPLVVSILLMSAPVGLVVSPSTSTALGGISSLNTGEETPAQSSPIVSRPDSPNILELSQDEVSIERVDQVTLAVDMAVSNEATSLQGNYSSLILQQQYEQADTTQANRSVLRDGSIYVQREVAELLGAAQTARLEYSNGQLSTREYLRTLSELNTKATALRGISSQVQEYTAQEPEIETDPELIKAENELMRFMGPVRNKISEAFDGSQDPLDLYIAAGPDGIVLGAFDGTQYVREAYYSPNREQVGNYSISSLLQASEQIAEIYPWVWNNTENLETEPSGPTDVYQFDILHQQGRMITHIDQRTADIFYEVQHLDIDSVPTETSTEREDDLRVTVDHSFAGGPAKITVTNASTEEPAAGTIQVNDRLIGEPNYYGEIWVLLPRENTISVTQGGSNVAIEVAT